MWFDACIFFHSSTDRLVHVHCRFIFLLHRFVNETKKISSTSIPGCKVCVCIICENKILIFCCLRSWNCRIENEKNSLKKAFLCVSGLVLLFYLLFVKTFDLHFWIYVCACCISRKKKDTKKKCNGLCAVFVFPSNSFSLSFFASAACFIHEH